MMVILSARNKFSVSCLLDGYDACYFQVQRRVSLSPLETNMWREEKMYE